MPRRSRPYASVAVALTANVSRVQQPLGHEASDKPFDLLSLLGAAVRVSAFRETLIVVSLGLSMADTFKLRQPSWYASPAEIARR